jgi:hypothetical protein
MIGKKFRLASDVVSVFGPVYGTAGAEVKVISVSGHVAIAEDGNGFRFPLMVAVLTQERVARQDTINDESAKAAATKNNSNTGQKRKQPSTPANQANLF